MKQSNANSVFSYWNSNVAKITNHSAFFPARAIVQRNSNEWSAGLGIRFDEITSLQSGWNGYKSKPVLFTIARFAADLLERIYIEGAPAPEIVPGNDGTLQIEWHINGYDIELDVLGVNDVVAWRRNLNTGQEEEFLLTIDFTQVVNWVQQLVVYEAENAIQAAG